MPASVLTETLTGISVHVSGIVRIFIPSRTMPGLRVRGQTGEGYLVFSPKGIDRLLLAGRLRVFAAGLHSRDPVFGDRLKVTPPAINSTRPVRIMHLHTGIDKVCGFDL